MLPPPSLDPRRDATPADEVCSLCQDSGEEQRPRAWAPGWSCTCFAHVCAEAAIHPQGRSEARCGSRCRPCEGTTLTRGGTPPGAGSLSPPRGAGVRIAVPKGRGAESPCGQAAPLPSQSPKHSGFGLPKAGHFGEAEGAQQHGESVRLCIRWRREGAGDADGSTS